MKKYLYHRSTSDNLENFYKDVSFKAGSGAMYGRGCYTCDNIKSQKQPYMFGYGDLVVRFETSYLKNILDFRHKDCGKTLCEQLVEFGVYRKGMIPDDFRKMDEVILEGERQGDDFISANVCYNMFVTGKNSKDYFGLGNICKIKGLDGVAYRGRHDGDVVVVYNLKKLKWSGFYITKTKDDINFTDKDFSLENPDKIKSQNEFIVKLSQLNPFFNSQTIEFRGLDNYCKDFAFYDKILKNLNLRDSVITSYEKSYITYIELRYDDPYFSGLIFNNMIFSKGDVVCKDITLEHCYLKGRKFIVNNIINCDIDGAAFYCRDLVENCNINNGGCYGFLNAEFNRFVDSNSWLMYKGRNGNYKTSKYLPEYISRCKEYKFSMFTEKEVTNK